MPPTEQALYEAGENAATPTQPLLSDKAKCSCDCQDPVRHAKRPNSPPSSDRSSVFNSLTTAAFVGSIALYAFAQVIYMAPLIQNDFNRFVSPYFGIPAKDPPPGSPLSAYGHYELLLPSFFVPFTVIPLLVSLLLFELLRDYNLHRNASRAVLRVSALLRRKPPSLFGCEWNYGFCYGELLFLTALVGGNLAVFVYSWVNQRKFLPLPGDDYTFNTTLELAGVAFGYNSVFNMAFLFLPCTRHCAWMEFFNISYANGVKYHRWLGIASLVTAVLHAVPFYWLWKRQGLLAEQALPCFDCSTAYSAIGYPKWFNVFGEISLFFMILLSVASIPWVRRSLFEVFYYVHHLYIPTVIFAVLHWVNILWWLLPTLVLYQTSRAISRWNSLFPVEVREFRALPDGIVKVVLSRSTQHNGNFDVGQFVYLNVPAISKLQWHAFTIGSSPRSTDDSLTILLKSLGNWTEDLVEHARECERLDRHPVVYMDGYYGASLEEYAEYPTVCLIGGGIGATPLFAILEDMVVRLSSAATGCSLLPRQRVFFIFTFRELALLEEIYPVVSKILALDPHAECFTFRFYLTRSPAASALDASIDYARFKTTSTSRLLSPLPVGNIPQQSDSQSENRRPRPPQAKESQRWAQSPAPFTEPLRRKSYKTAIYIGTLLPLTLLVLWLEFGGGVLMAHGTETQYWPLQNFVEIATLFVFPLAVYAALFVERTFGRQVQSPRMPAMSEVLDTESGAATASGSYGATSLRDPSSWSMDSLASDIATFRELLVDLNVAVGVRPDMKELMREVQECHREALSGARSGERSAMAMNRTVGVFISGPEALKRSTDQAVAELGANEFDVHEEEFEL